MFFVPHFQATVTQMAYPFQLLLQRFPQLLWLQLGVERTAAAAARLTPGATKLLQLVLSSSSSNSSYISSSSSDSCNSSAVNATPHLKESLHDEFCGLTEGSFSAALPAATRFVAVQPAVQSDVLSSVNGSIQQQHVAGASSSVADLFDQRPGPAPDVGSLAGRFILASCCVYMLFVVLLLPMYIAWHMERHAKVKWIASMQKRQQQQQQHVRPTRDTAEAASAEAPDNAARGSSNNSTESRPQNMVLEGEQSAAAAAAPSGVLPPTPVLLRHLGLMLAVSVVIGEALVLILCIAPDLKSFIWEQIVYYEY
jgi:hypothetical protein